MRVIDINGRLATAGSWDETSQSEADAQARLRATRTGLRAMLAGNEAFHVDPMAAPDAGDLIHRYTNRAEYDAALAALLHSGVGVAPVAGMRIDFRDEQWAGSAKVGMVYIGVKDIDGGGCHFLWADTVLAWVETRCQYAVWLKTAGQRVGDTPKAEIVAAAFDRMIADCTPASGAALIGTKTEPEAEVWHTEAPTVAGVYVADFVGQNRHEGRSYFDGKCWSWVWMDESDGVYVARSKLKKHLDGVVHWLRLIEADTPAPAAQESEYIVCIKGSKWLKVGQIVHQVGGGFDPECWARCDSEGWIPHQPTADAVCPVPNGVSFVGKWCDGDVMPNVPYNSDYLWQKKHDLDAAFVAWRPIQA